MWGPVLMSHVPCRPQRLVLAEALQAGTKLVPRICVSSSVKMSRLLLQDGKGPAWSAGHLGAALETALTRAQRAGTHLLEDRVLPSALRRLEAVLGTAGCRAASLASTHEVPIAPLQLGQPAISPDVIKCLSVLGPHRAGSQVEGWGTAPPP